jgi:hypothetical protein
MATPLSELFALARTVSSRDVDPATLSELITALSPSSPPSQHAASAAKLLGAEVSVDALVQMAALSRQIQLDQFAALPPPTPPPPVLCRFSPPDHLYFEIRDDGGEGRGARSEVVVTCTAPVLFKVKTQHPHRVSVKPMLHLLEPGASVTVQVDVLPKHLAEFLADVAPAHYGAGHSRMQFMFSQLPLGAEDAAAARARVDAGERTKDVLDPLWKRVEGEVAARGEMPRHNKLFAAMAPTPPAGVSPNRGSGGGGGGGSGVGAGGGSGGGGGGGGSAHAEAAPAIPALRMPPPPPQHLQLQQLQQTLPAGAVQLTPAARGGGGRAAEGSPAGGGGIGGGGGGGGGGTAGAAEQAERAALRQQYNETLQLLLVARADKDSQERAATQLLVENEVRRRCWIAHPPISPLCSRSYPPHSLRAAPVLTADLARAVVVAEAPKGRHWRRRPTAARR